MTDKKKSDGQKSDGQKSNGIGWFSLRNKLMAFSLILALIPLGLAGNALIRITRDELKSSANEEILLIAEQVSADIDASYSDIWLAPLRLISRSITSEQLGVDEIRALLKTSVSEIPGVVATQITVSGMENALLATRDDFVTKMNDAGLDPMSTFSIPYDQAVSWRGDRPADVMFAGDAFHQKATDTWMVVMVIPLPGLFPERDALLAAHVDLARIRTMLKEHPFNRSGNIMIADHIGGYLFETTPQNGKDPLIVAQAREMLASAARSTQIQPYTRTTGEKMLAGYTFPQTFPWAVVLERDEAVAYKALELMDASLKQMVLGGIALAIIGAAFFALRISRPVEEISRVAMRVREGDLDAKVSNIKSKDEIALLARQMNNMTAGLQERDFIRETFGRYVAPEVAQRVLSDPNGLKPGGDLRTVTVFMSDLRGFTSLSEQLSPADMIDLLNAYLGEMADIVSEYGGTVIEFIGDAIMALFGAPIQGEDDALKAVACAARMQIELERFNAEHTEIPPLRMGVGINTGRVIVGNIGSERRMKYGVVGDDVNLAARVESFTIGGEVMVSRATHDLIADKVKFRGPFEVAAKGKKEKLELFAVVSVGGEYDLDVPHEHREEAELKAVNLPVDVFRLKGKEVSETAEIATITGLGEEEAELQTAYPLAVFDNLKLTIKAGPKPIDEVYAKVTKTEKDGADHLHRLVVTSVPEHHRESFEKLGEGV